MCDHLCYKLITVFSELLLMYIVVLCYTCKFIRSNESWVLCQWQCPDVLFQKGLDFFTDTFKIHINLCTCSPKEIIWGTQFMDEFNSFIPQINEGDTYCYFYYAFRYWGVIFKNFYLRYSQESLQPAVLRWGSQRPRFWPTTV